MQYKASTVAREKRDAESWGLGVDKARQRPAMAAKHKRVSAQLQLVLGKHTS